MAKLGKRELWVLRQCAKNSQTVYPGYATVLRRLRQKGLLEPLPAWDPHDKSGTEPTLAGRELLLAMKKEKGE